MPINLLTLFLMRLYTALQAATAVPQDTYCLTKIHIPCHLYIVIYYNTCQRDSYQVTWEPGTGKQVLGIPEPSFPDLCRTRSFNAAVYPPHLYPTFSIYHGSSNIAIILTQFTLPPSPKFLDPLPGTYVHNFIPELRYDRLDADAGLQAEYIAHLGPALEHHPLVHLVPQGQDEPVTAVQLSTDEAVKDGHGVLVLEEARGEDHYGVLSVVDRVVAGRGLRLCVEFNAEIKVFELPLVVGFLKKMNFTSDNECFFVRRRLHCMFRE